MLDLGGGPGSYALALARRYPDTEAVIFDRDDRALNMAREEIEKQKLERRVSLKKGDFFVDDLGNDYDFAPFPRPGCEAFRPHSKRRRSQAGRDKIPRCQPP